jgi:hypothetical protein
MDSHHTPEWILDLFKGWFDPCPFNPEPILDGLSLAWPNKTYVNPPYSNPLPWVEKAIEESKKGKQIALLLKLDCSTKWYKLLHEANAHLLLFNERVKFNGKAPPFPNALFILNNDRV